MENPESAQVQNNEESILVKSILSTSIDSTTTNDFEVVDTTQENNESSVSNNTKYADSFTRKRQRKLRYQPKNVELGNHSDSEYYKKLLSTEDKVNIPKLLVIEDHLKACESEINSMMTAVSRNGSAKTMLQRLPRHMRRRAASHNIKRLPRRHHELARYLGKAGTQPECRKKRRRNIAKQNKLARKTKKPQWLETHLWHAKRFHMSKITDKRFNNWDEYVPIYANDKSFRASYRSVSQHCLIQDISYMKCFKLTGSESQLAAILKLLTFSGMDLSSIQGKEVDVLLISCDGKIIGPAKVSCVKDPLNGVSYITVWFHPVMLPQTHTTLKEFSTQDFSTFGYENISNQLNRFRLIGPKSYATLLSVLRPFVSTDINNETTSSLECWIANNKDIINQQLQCFNSSMIQFHKHLFLGEDDSMISENVTFAIIVNDPRLTLPLKRSKPKLNAYENLDSFETMNTDRLWESPLWNKDILQHTANTRKPDHVVSTRKHNVTVSGNSKTEIVDLSTPVPIVVNKFAGFQRKNITVGESAEKSYVHSGPCSEFGAGCDVIIPKNWATAFWVPFVYHQSRAGGLREHQNVDLQCLKPHFPEDYPETHAAAIWWEAESQEQAKLYYRKPPAKRNNYVVLGTPSPFKPNWENVLYKENSSCKNEFKTESDKNASGVLLISDNVQSIGSKRRNNSTPDDEPSRKLIKEESSNDEKCKFKNEVCKPVKVMRQLSSLNYLGNEWKKSFINKSIFNATDLNELETNVLVPIHCLVLAKGSPTRNAMIFLPNDEDYNEISSCFTDPYKNGLQSLHGPTEKHHWKEKRIQFKNDKNAKAIMTKNKRPLQFDVTPSRKVVGYLTSADYLYTFACGGGVGFMSYSSLVTAMERQSAHMSIQKIINHPISQKVLVDKSCFKSPIFVLIRNPDTAQYRFAKVEIQQ